MEKYYDVMTNLISNGHKRTKLEEEYRAEKHKLEQQLAELREQHDKKIGLLDSADTKRTKKALKNKVIYFNLGDLCQGICKTHHIKKSDLHVNLQVVMLSKYPGKLQLEDLKDNLSKIQKLDYSTKPYISISVDTKFRNENDFSYNITLPLDLDTKMLDGSTLRDHLVAEHQKMTDESFETSFHLDKRHVKNLMINYNPQNVLYTNFSNNGEFYGKNVTIFDCPPFREAVDYAVKKEVDRTSTKENN